MMKDSCMLLFIPYYKCFFCLWLGCNAESKGLMMKKKQFICEANRIHKEIDTASAERYSKSISIAVKGFLGFFLYIRSIRVHT